MVLFFSSQTLIPQVMYADATINDDGEDDYLIDPGMNYLSDENEDMSPETLLQPVVL
jgi:hypothetical protein